jgi:hypothetical protein
MDNPADPLTKPVQESTDPLARPLPVRFIHNTYWLGGYFIVTSIILTMFIFMLWPKVIPQPEENQTREDTVVTATNDINGSDTTSTATVPAIRHSTGSSIGNNESNSKEDTWVFFGKVIPISYESRLILLVLLVGALGSYVYAVTSFATYAGNRTLTFSWLWWYLLRPFIGGPLALIFYFVIRGGFLSTGADAGSLSLYGIAGLSALVGMFSKNAIDKLQEVFETMFRSKEGKGDNVRSDKAIDPAMVETAMIPVNKITSYVLPEDKPLSEITLEGLYDLLKGSITRVPVMSVDNKIRYIIHQSILYQYIANQSVSQANSGNIFKINESFLDSFLNDPKINEYVEKSIAVINRKATLSEAKQKMEATKNCQDVFVTENGLPEEPLLGWLTNVDISKNIKE